MTRMVRITDKQQVTLDDFQALAQDPRNTMDVVVGTAIEEEAKYAGGAVTRTATTKVTVATPLRLYRQGRVYTRDDLNGVEIDLLPHLPAAGNARIVAIVAQGQELQDETEERDFEVDGTVFPPVVEAAPTQTRVWRKCEVAAVVGSPAPTPIKPAVDVALTVLAYVTLTSTEVSATIEQVEENRIVPLGGAVQRVKGLEGWRGRADATARTLSFGSGYGGPGVATPITDIANGTGRALVAMFCLNTSFVIVGAPLRY